MLQLLLVTAPRDDRYIAALRAVVIIAGLYREDVTEAETQVEVDQPAPL